MHYYFVIIGDIVQSRKIKNRAEVQQKLNLVLNKLTNEEAEVFLSPPTLTIGDEFQAVLKTTHKLFSIIHRFEIDLHPVQIRFGLGLGNISTPLNTQAAIGMDGSAFHHARTAIEQARQQNRKYLLISESTATQIEVSLALLLNWIDLSLQSWGIDKIKILQLHRQGKRQKEIAALLNISQPAVSQHINKPLFNLLIETERFLENKLNEFLKA